MSTPQTQHAQGGLHLNPMELISKQPYIRLYIWDVVVRSTHWVIAPSMILLAVTGIYLGNPFIIVPGEAGAHFVMGWMKTIHIGLGFMFALAVVTRLIWMFIGPRRANWRELVPVERERQIGILATIAFYIWLRESPPRSPGHNPLAGVTYIGVFFLYLVMVFTGLGLYAMAAHVDSPFRIFNFMSSVLHPQTMRLVHHGVMWLLLGFAVHHIFSAELISEVKRNGTIESIFSGYKWVAPSEAQREAERWAKRKR